MKRYCLFLLLLILAHLPACAQADSNKWLPAPAQHYAFINTDENVISKPAKLDSFFKKLVRLKNTRSGKVTIVHIGDSHLQADGITKVLRDGFRDYFGDAGRGLLFPYQLAGSNAPHDLSATSNVSWHGGKITNADIRTKTGLCGYYIESDKKGAAVRMHLKETDGRQESFNRLVFFLGKERDSYRLTDSSTPLPAALATFAGADTPSVLYERDAMMTDFELSKSELANSDNYNFYGVSLERKNAPGVLYHTIGVNGARYDQYVENDLFWQQLSALHGDLFIVSLGTNEAQNQGINEQAFIATCDSFVRRIHTIAPRAQVLITTPAGSYYRKKKPNACVQRLSADLVSHCNQSGIPCWNMYEIGGGSKGIPSWKKTGLLGGDLVHYTPVGYQLQGALLLNALARSYNSYAKLHPYQPEPVTPASAPVVQIKETKAFIKPAAVARPILPPVVATPPAPKKDSTSPFNQPPPRPKKLKVLYLDN